MCFFCILPPDPEKHWKQKENIVLFSQIAHDHNMSKLRFLSAKVLRH